MRFAVLLFAALLAAASVGAATTRVPPENAAVLQLSYAPVVRAAAPAVVNIYSRKVVERSRRLPPMFDDPFFREFFGRNSPFGAPRRRVQNSLGSGVLVRPDGIIVTNRHVVADATEVTVVLADRREFEAEILGTDERTDLAVLRIDAKGETLPVLPLRDSDEVEVGDIVLAIGNPFGVGQTVTSGIVSAIARTEVNVGKLDFFIQTDAAINPGNSGGALVDMTGALVGINTAIYSRSGGSLGIGFAIPSNIVRTVVAGITGNGKLVRPWLGAWTREVSSDIAESLGLPRPRGVLVEEVYEGGPADAAGLRVGDIVLRVGSHDVDHPDALSYHMATQPVGGTANLRILRRGKELTLSVALVAAPEDPPRDVTELTGRNPLQGAVVANMSPALAEEMGEGRVQRGIVVLDVHSGSAAARYGVQRGDRIISVDGSDPESVDDLQRALAGRRAIRRIRIRRGRQTLEWRLPG